MERRGSQVVRQGSAKALCVGSIPTLASNSKHFCVSVLGGSRAFTGTKTGTNFWAELNSGHAQVNSATT